MRPPGSTALRLAIALGLIAPAGLSGRQAETAVELRAGAAFSSSFAQGIAVVPGEVEASVHEVSVGPGPAPSLGLSVSRALDDAVAVELRGGAAFATVRGSGRGASWHAGSLVAAQVLGGVRVRVPAGLDLRGAVGKAFYAGDDVQLLSGGANTGLLISGAVGARLPVGRPTYVVVEAQRHGFGTTPLRAAGAPDGSVLRVVVEMTVEVWGAR